MAKPSRFSRLFHRRIRTAHNVAQDDAPSEQAEQSGDSGEKVEQIVGPLILAEGENPVVE